MPVILALQRLYFCFAEQGSSLLRQDWIDRHAASHFKPGPLCQAGKDLNVPQEVFALLFAAWKVSHPADAEFPLWQALCTEAWWEREAGDADGAARHCDRALAVDRRLGPFDRTADVRDLLRWSEARRRR